MGHFSKIAQSKLAHSLASLGLLLLALAALWQFGQPLWANADALAGRNQVYTNALLGRLQGEAMRAQWLLWGLTHPLVALSLPALGAWLMLQVSANRMPRAGWLCLAAAMGLALLGYAVDQHGLVLTWQQDDNRRLPLYFYGAAAGLLILWPLAVRVCKRWQWLSLLGEPLPALQTASRPSVWAFPAFVFIIGMSLWLLDYAARGAGQHRWLGIRQYGAWVLALWVYAAGASVRLVLMQGLAWVLSRVQRSHKRVQVVFALLLLAYIVSVVVYGATNHRRHGLTSELLRLPFYIGLGWFYYRYASQLSRAALLKGLVLLSEALLVAIVLSGDSGPALVWIYSGWVMFCVSAMQQEQVKAGAGQGGTSPWRKARLMLGLLGGLLGIHLLVTYFGGSLSDSLWLRDLARHDLSTLAERMLESQKSGEDAPVTPYDFLLRLHWFMQAAVQSSGISSWLGGYGLGAVPWCGHSGNLGAVCAGLPLQTHSDYALAGLIGSFGLPLTLFCLVLLTLLLWRLLGGFALPTLQPVNHHHLCVWICTVFALMQIVQMAQSLLGTLGTTPMTGVTLPLLAYGSSALLSCAFFLGLGDAVPASPNKTTSSVYPVRANLARGILKG